jgi:hypothetical protein
MYPGNTNHTHTPLPVLHTGYPFDLAARLYRILPSPGCIRGIPITHMLGFPYYIRATCLILPPGCIGSCRRLYVSGEYQSTHAPLPVLHTGYPFDLAARLYRILPSPGCIRGIPISTHAPLPVLHTGYPFDLATRLYRILPSPGCIRGIPITHMLGFPYYIRATRLILPPGCIRSCRSPDVSGEYQSHTYSASRITYGLPV